MTVPLVFFSFEEQNIQGNTESHYKQTDRQTTVLLKACIIQSSGIKGYKGNTTGLVQTLGLQHYHVELKTTTMQQKNLRANNFTFYAFLALVFLPLQYLSFF